MPTDVGWSELAVFGSVFGVGIGLTLIIVKLVLAPIVRQTETNLAELKEQPVDTT